METNVKTLVENKNLLEGIARATTPDELMEVFSSNNIQLEDGMTKEQAFEMVKKQVSGELSVSELEHAYGGIAITLALAATGCFVAGGAALCFLGGYAYQTCKKWWR